MVTTPESLYLLLTAASSRVALETVRLVIVDEAHATARDRRGAHLALSLERLQHLQGDRRLQRIALSATQRPVETVGRLVTGAVPSPAGCAVVDLGPVRHVQLRVDMPDGDLEAVASTEQMHDIADRIARRVAEHRTTLVFVNTRRMAERLARLLGDRLGADQVVAHHGSLSAERRLAVEQRLRAGELRALVATSSLELGIDVGPVDLVCQLGSPRQVATFLQRVGRANHRRHGVPEGIVLPTSRDDLVECVALVAAARDGRLDAVEPPVAPLDILAQQVVAEVAAAGEWSEQALYELVRRAAPYQDLPRAAFDDVVRLVTDGVPTGHGRPMAFLHRDRVHGILRPRRGARLTAITCGGAIVDAGEYQVVLEGDDAVVGTVTEDFAIESMVGDVFVLGTHSWQVRRVEPGVVRVVDAAGAAPTIPFWVGEAPSRSRELSDAVSELRATVAGAPSAADAVAAVVAHSGVTAEVAEQVVTYLRAGMAQLGVMPTTADIVVERFFDEVGTMQLVVHAPFGGRVTRALGLALRKRLCATFDFELQAAANDDAVLLSLGAQHGFAVSDVWRLLRADRVREVLEQAVLTAPAFRLRWRHTCSRALAVQRQRGGRRTPLAIQRMQADDLMAAVFPALAACQENTPPGPVRVPDHVLVRQTVQDCLHELLDVDGLVELVRAADAGRLRVHAVDTSAPSVLAHEILAGKPYTFLDDAPLEERRSRAVGTGRGVPLTPALLAHVDPAVIDEVVARRRRPPRDAEELHDQLLRRIVAMPEPACTDLFEALVGAGRAAAVVPGPAPEAGGPGGWRPELRWCAIERRAWVQALFPAAAVIPDGGRLADESPIDPDQAVADLLEGHLRELGPVTVDDLAALTGVPASRVRVGLAVLQQRGVALEGRHDPRIADVAQWCARPVLAQIHAQVRRRRRAGIEPVTAEGLMRFLLAWQHVVPGTQRSGRSGLLELVGQLQGYEAAAGAWEQQLFARRMERYRPMWLDELCQAGRIAWGRVGLRTGERVADGSVRTGVVPSRATPITFARRSDLPWLVAAARGNLCPVEPRHGAAHEILEHLQARGALFHDDLASAVRRLPDDVEAGLWDLVTRGLAAADGFAAVRSLLDGRHRSGRRRPGRRRVDTVRGGPDGRWSLLPPPADMPSHDLAEAVARQLLARWGIVLWELVQRETLAVPWRQLVAALRRLEDRGEALGGRFVTSFSGYQFAHPLAPAELERARRPADDTVVELSAADPLNLVGVVLPGPRPPSTPSTLVVYRAGALVDVVAARRQPRRPPPGGAPGQGGTISNGLAPSAGGHGRIVTE